MSYATAAGHSLTAESAAAVLAEGGTAVDACISAAFTAFVAEPILAGPLGGGFLMIVPDQGRSQCLDAFVQTPSRKRPESDVDIREVEVNFGPATQTFHAGAATIATPCLMQGLFEAHSRFGRIPMPELAADAVRHARAGIAVSGFQAHVLELVAAILRCSDEAAALHFDGNTPKRIFANPALAETLEVLALEGPRFFREGEVAQALLGLNGAHLGASDLRQAAPIWRNPLRIERFQTRLSLNPVPSLGGVQIALALSALPHRPRPEVIARAFAEIGRIRRETRIDAHPILADDILLDPDLVTDLRAVLMQHDSASRGTTHISAIDAKGMGAALTLSNGEGCGLILPGTGIMPNNMLGEEDLVTNAPMGWQPDLRLSSMMCPMALRNGAGDLVMMGSGGSNRIRSALTQVALRLTDEGCNLEEAIHAPRLHVEGGSLDFEDTGGERARAALLRDWPEATIWDAPHMFFGGVHAVARGARGAVSAAGDQRRDGAARLSP